MGIPRGRIGTDQRRTVSKDRKPAGLYAHAELLDKYDYDRENKSDEHGPDQYPGQNLGSDFFAVSATHKKHHPLFRLR